MDGKPIVAVLTQQRHFMLHEAILCLFVTGVYFLATRNKTPDRTMGELTVSKVRKCDFLDAYAVNSIVVLYTELKSIFF